MTEAECYHYYYIWKEDRGNVFKEICKFIIEVLKAISSVGTCISQFKELANFQ